MGYPVPAIRHTSAPPTSNMDPPEVRDKEEILRPQIEVGLATQEYLAKSHEARDMQYGPWGEVVELDTVELQQTP